MGEALLEGRDPEGEPRRKGKAFGKWCADNGFGDMLTQYRTDAMWLAGVSEDELRDGLYVGLNHPTTIRKAYRKATKPT